MDTNIKLSVAIPVHGMKGATEFLIKSLEMLNKQTFRNFEVIVSDNSDDDLLRSIVAREKWDFKRKVWERNPIKGMAPNTNNAMRMCEGELIKILYLDDFLFDEHSLQTIVDNFMPEDNWLVTGCTHFDGEKYYNPHMPLWNDNIHLGNNTIGSPSVLTIRNNDPLLFDESMTWLLDCDLYKRMYERYGAPKIVNKLGVVIGTGSHQATNTMGEARKKQEEEYIKQKYGN